MSILKVPGTQQNSKRICKNQDGDWIVIHLDEISTSPDMFSVTPSISAASGNYIIDPRTY